MIPITKLMKSLSVLAVLLVSTACMAEKEDNRASTGKPEGTITVIENKDHPSNESSVTVKGVESFEKMQILDWLDEDTVIVSKINESLGKMSMAELTEAYPRSLYRYQLSTKKYEDLKVKKDALLGEAELSEDKKYLIYSEASVGDPTYFVMSFDTLKEVKLSGEPIGGAISANWADNDSIIGAAYSGGAYLADKTGKITKVDELPDELLVIVHKMKDKIYYNTNADEALQMLDLATQTKTSMNLDHVYNIVPSPNEDQIMVLQSEGDKQKLILCDENGGHRKTIAEGAEFGGMSWSQDQRMIAYSMKAEVNGSTVHGIYLYDLLNDKSTRVAVGTGNAITNWSPSGNSIVYVEWNGTQYNSHVVHVEYSL